MIDLGKPIKCIQRKNTSVFPACSTYVQCAKTLLDLPLGMIKSVYTIANDEWCDRVYYQETSKFKLDCMAHSAVCAVEWTAPDNVGMQALQQGIKFAERSTDSAVGRARYGVWAKDRGIRLVLYPWIQSNESVVVEWDGYKTTWNDDDVLDLDLWTPDYFQAVKTYVMWRHENQFGTDPGLKRDLKAQYEEERGDLMYECEKRLRERESEICTPGRLPTKSEVDDDAVPEVDTGEINFAIIADYGQNSAGELAVSQLVKSWNPEFILANGDCDYVLDYDLSNGQYYQEYIAPYVGAYGSGAADGVNKFFPTPANHDWDADGVGATTLAKFLAFFTGTPGNRRYYELVRGPVHFFLLSSDQREPDGNTSTSKQAEWLRAKMMLSPARWKAVLIHDPPYTNHVDTPGILTSRWPFEDWGADIVVSGDAHSHQRFLIDGFNYIVNGTGGAALSGFIAPDIAGTVIKYNENYGALKCFADCDTLTFEFINVAGVVIDTLTLTK